MQAFQKHADCPQGGAASLQLLGLTRHGEGYYCQKEIWSGIILPAYFLKEISSGVRQERYSKWNVVVSIQIYFTQVI